MFHKFNTKKYKQEILVQQLDFLICIKWMKNKIQAYIVIISWKPLVKEENDSLYDGIVEWYQMKSETYIPSMSIQTCYARRFPTRGG